MKVVIDTNSLLSLVRYYLPFDKKGVLFNFFKTKIEKGEIIIIDKVLEQSTFISKKIIVQKLDFLNDKNFLKKAKVPYKTDNLLVQNTKLFFHQLNNVFVNHIVKKAHNITDVEFENRKNAFINEADMKQIFLCLNLIKNGERVVLVTEETESSNDNKLFKKIPAICKELEIETMTLPELITKYDGIDIDFK
ncbi:MAG TPA: DUF4411 family protein [Bacteroidia bacterium]|nr:DUF4411 family protein [Bacteroidia bacterium]HNR49923.1 DUF4411 family protein [Bacteroidia bacterium]HNT83498.1 DUF4411 family protein [Bacteroidia bacterium]